MNSHSLAVHILSYLGHEPTPGQQILANHLAAFIYMPSLSTVQPLFVLKGFAGTGKTTLVSALVKALPSTGIKTVLLAPTGRAAKVLGAYAGMPAYTIHKKIYVQHALKNGGITLTLRKNLHKSTLFIVDEASMIQNHVTKDEATLFAPRDLLTDLIEYVHSSNCRLLLVGDTAQLPPVGMAVSPALDIAYLKSSYAVEIKTFELTEVVRQETTSGILYNATQLRKRLVDDEFQPPYFVVNPFTDVQQINGQLFEELLHGSIDKAGTEAVVVITRTNKRANLFNKAIRYRVLFRDEELSAGDLMMVVRNNYFWLPPESQAAFIANGDTIEIMRINKHEELYGFRFADVSIRLVDYPEEPLLDVKILLNTLDSETPALNEKDTRLLFEQVLLDYPEILNQRGKMEQARTNPWLNALQVKFAYALTCHKTQGGQWEQVFIDQGYITDEMLNREYLRWLYTAITRATRKVYLVNFAEKFFEL